MAECKICLKPYFGRTVQITAKRMRGHRECYYQILRNDNVDQSKDDYALGLHLFHQHGLLYPEDFDSYIRIQIVEVCSPFQLEKKNTVMYLSNEAQILTSWTLSKLKMKQIGPINFRGHQHCLISVISTN